MLKSCEHTLKGLDREFIKYYEDIFENDKKRYEFSSKNENLMDKKTKKYELANNYLNQKKLSKIF